MSADLQAIESKEILALAIKLGDSANALAQLAIKLLEAEKL